MAKGRFDYEDNAPKTKLTKDNLKAVGEIFQFIRPYRWSFWVGMILLFLSTTTFMIFPFLAGRVVDIALGKRDFVFSFNGKNIPYYLDLPRVGYILAGLLVIQGIISYFRVTLFARVSEYGIADMKMAIYKKMVSLPITFFENSRVGELVSRVTSDVERLYNTFSITLAEFLRQVIILVSGVVILFFVNKDLAVIMLCSFPIIVVGAMFFGRFVRKMAKERQTQIAETNVILNETMQAINAVKAFTNESFEIIRFDKANKKSVIISMKSAAWRAVFATYIVVVLFGSLFFVLWKGAEMVQNGFEPGLLITFFVYSAILGGAIAGLGNFYTELVSAVGATERVREILNSESEVTVRDVVVLPEKKLKGNVEFRDIHFQYPSRPDVGVLKGVNLSIKAGQKVALVGPSGAGKSTIVQLMLKFHLPTAPLNRGDDESVKGGIFVDGQNINDMDITDYRSNMAIVPQEVLLFGGTIRENILYGKPDATDEEIIEAAKQSNSWEFISQFPEGLETTVGERGIKLSGGQRQRIAIARAILRNPSILLLDEATSSLDAESEKVVQEALNILMQGRTSIIIAHRLATVREVDKICVIDNGIIVEQGTHEELYEKEDGLYASLARLQFENA
jgi:ATP-binding cassette, subfamily B, bacterial